MAKKTMGRRNAFEERLSAMVFGRLSEKERRAIDYVVKNKIPVLFMGKSRTGKTLFAKELREMGIVAYAPEDISVIELGVKDTEVEALKNDSGYPVLLSRMKVVRLV
jgi:ATP-dependent protease Clp ATPase subunit